MATCPQGHASGSDDYCDVCGAMIAAPAATTPSQAAGQATQTVEGCPVCATPRVGSFCEVCGHSFEGGAPPVQAPLTGARWEAVAAADRAYYEQVIAQEGPDAAAMAFPPYCPERSFPLTGEQVRIGRSRRGRDLVPEIDLAGPPTDPGVSNLHAVLLGQPDGSWMLVDPGSANGTLLNGKPVTVNVPVPVRAGDRVHLGAWTVITIREGTP
ncbi:FHA domain-containing protein [Nonomuraea sp. NPDC048826]|uniref:FHA domain-containing protein n=1 Tax=Nonomuraea sp. NPDC048826 TaxID=3364347 RepID=UPI00372120C8